MKRTDVELLAMIRSMDEATLRNLCNELSSKLVELAAEVCRDHQRIRWSSHETDRQYQARLIRETANNLSGYQSKRFRTLWPIRFDLVGDPVYPVSILGATGRCEEGRDAGLQYEISWPVWQAVRDSLDDKDRETMDLLLFRQRIEEAQYAYKSSKGFLDGLGIDPEIGTVFAA